MRRLFIDTTVLAYAAGDEHPDRAVCRALFAAAQQGVLELHVSTEAIQELLHHRLRRATRIEAVAEAKAATATCRIHAFDESVLRRSLELVGSTGLRGRDAVHAATALEHGFDSVVTADRDFDGVPGLRRIDPSAALA
jgi:predicted nucleic acid-binding protein